MAVPPHSLKSWTQSRNHRLVYRHHHPISMKWNILLIGINRKLAVNESIEAGFGNVHSWHNQLPCRIHALAWTETLC